MLRRLQLLFHHGYLDRPLAQLSWYTKGSEPLVYALGRKGAKALEADGQLIRSRVLQWGKKNRNPSRVFLQHTLAVVEIMVAFEVAACGWKRVQLIQPEEVLAGAPASTRRLRLPFRWQVEVREGGKPYRLGVEPDRVFGLRFGGLPEGRERAFFFLEADRGTMPVTRKGLTQTSFLRKLLAYRETWRQGLQRAHLGIPNFRVLTVTTNKERVGHLVEASQALSGGSRLFLFTDLERFGHGDILAQEWVNGWGEVVRILAES